MLELKNLTKEYKGNMALHDINLTFYEGEITGILGRNGSGKTTMLKCILNLLTVSEGEILWDGKQVYDQYDKVAFISEEGSYLPNLTADRYGEFLATYYSSFDKVYYKQLLEQFEIDTNHMIQEQSKGQKMKIEIAAGFAMRAKLIILDEPFNGLDIYAKEATIKLLIEQLQADTIILLSTHNLEEIENVVDRCVIVDRARIMNDVKLEDLHERGQDLKALMDMYK